MAFLERLEALWASLQVELKGSYSVERMHSIKKYAEKTSYAHALIVIICTPIPCLVAVLCTDCFKLPSPAEGVHHSQRLWLRSAVVNFVISWTQLQRCYRFVSGLPVTPVFDLFSSWLVGFGTAGFSWVLALLIGYPLPFTMVVAAAGWWLIALPLVFIRFGTLIRTNPEICRQMKLYGWSILMEMFNGTIYPAYNIIFMDLGVKQQIAFSLLLPVIKILLKNLTRHLFLHKEDLIPEVVVFTIEIFHSLFLVIFMQNARSIGTTLVLMGVDFACSTLAVRDVQHVLAHNIERCAADYAAKNGISMRVTSILGIAEYIL